MSRDHGKFHQVHSSIFHTSFTQRDLDRLNDQLRFLQVALRNREEGSHLSNLASLENEAFREIEP